MNHYKLITLHKENGNAFFLDIIKRFWLAVLFKKANLQWHAKLIFPILFIFLATKGYSQQTINVTNHSAKINGMLFEYAIGEMTLISTDKNNQLIVTQGFLQSIIQQSSISFAMNASENVTDKLNDSPIKVYPNPSNREVVRFNQVQDVKVYDTLGKLVLSAKNASSIDTKSFNTGIYFIKTANGLTKKLIVN